MRRLLIVKSNRLFVLAMFMGGGLLGMETSGYQYILLKIAKEFGLSQTEMGSLVSVHFLAVTLIPPVMGVLADKAGKKPVICGCFLYLLGAGACCLASDSAGFAGGIFAVGAAFGTLLTTCQAALSDSVPGGAGRYVSALQGTLCAGCVLSPVILSFVMGAFAWTWRILFLICSSGFILMAGLLLFAEVPDRRPLAKKRQNRVEMQNKTLAGVMLGIFLYM